ncbi:hypothetical protein [Actinotalea ferrariae]|uniref:hypothetical protein n=1 Tax=Actinotalea ferrariae TaxID=1386098 RepID=UPI0012DD4146|nr:hypothetical protein [Actinotalea ferrariae]
MSEKRPPRHGENAAALGLVALVLVVVPGIGELLAAPLGVAAIVVGLLGVRQYEMRRAPRVAAALAGLALGVLALLAVVFVLVATS